MTAIQAGKARITINGQEVGEFVDATIDHRRERPILFRGTMVRAILKGEKTQTRRVMKRQPDQDGLAKLKQEFGGHWEDTDGNAYLCPYGQPGDCLWVRETWADVRGMGFDDPLVPGAKMQVAFRAGTSWEGIRYAREYGVKWKPSIFMPRSACRIVLEVTRVRVERLQDISQPDARAEGVDEWMHELRNNLKCGYDPDGQLKDYPTTAFSRMWNRSNERTLKSWEANPWVWVVEFRRVQ